MDKEEEKKSKIQHMMTRTETYNRRNAIMFLKLYICLIKRCQISTAQATFTGRACIETGANHVMQKVMESIREFLTWFRYIK